MLCGREDARREGLDGGPSLRPRSQSGEAPASPGFQGEGAFLTGEPGGTPVQAEGSPPCWGCASPALPGRTTGWAAGSRGGGQVSGNTEGGERGAPPPASGGEVTLPVSRTVASVLPWWPLLAENTAVLRARTDPAPPTGCGWGAPSCELGPRRWGGRHRTRHRPLKPAGTRAGARPPSPAAARRGRCDSTQGPEAAGAGRCSRPAVLDPRGGPRRRQRAP